MKLGVKAFVLKNYNTLLCVSRTQRIQEIYASARRTHLHTVEVAPCLTIAWRSQATRLAETKETRDITRTSDWLK